mmetsp:Transcript_14490/g.25975  ORF Transcript_14490/g.25975 Transcript_14490/m.25975 type:complete len:244 (+) Transcript_14490:476-1207(+)
MHDMAMLTSSLRCLGAFSEGSSLAALEIKYPRAKLVQADFRPTRTSPKVPNCSDSFVRSAGTPSPLAAPRVDAQRGKPGAAVPHLGRLLGVHWQRPHWSCWLEPLTPTCCLSLGSLDGRLDSPNGRPGVVRAAAGTTVLGSEVAADSHFGPLRGRGQHHQQLAPQRGRQRRWAARRRLQARGRSDDLCIGILRPSLGSSAPGSFWVFWLWLRRPARRRPVSQRMLRKAQAWRGPPQENRAPQP